MNLDPLSIRTFLVWVLLGSALSPVVQGQTSGTPYSPPVNTQTQRPAAPAQNASPVTNGQRIVYVQLPVQIPVVPVSGPAELTEEQVVQIVVAQNPTLAQMQAVAEVAAARYPQVISLDDPMFAASQYPSSIGSNNVEFAYRIEASQRIPYPGKRSLRGQNALAEARAANSDVDDTRLQLIESARMAYYDYYLVERALDVNRQNLELLQEFRRNAESRYKTGLVTQQDVLQADVEIGRQRERLLTLERMRPVAIARLNTLMHQSPDVPLPPPLKQLSTSTVAFDVVDLRSMAMAHRPDLQAIANRLEAERAALALACKEYKPDFEVMAVYDAAWQGSDRDLRTMVGVRMNLPVRLNKRDAAVAEARAKIALRQAELAKQTDQANFEVQQAFEQVRESEKAMRLYNETILPAARENVKAAQTAYVTAKIPFLSLIEAQRSLVGLLDRSYETIAEYHRRKATLERVVGGPVIQVPR